MFIVTEGANGSGKTSIKNMFVRQGVKTLSSPGETELSNILRPICRGTDQWKDNIDPIVQFLLFSAARLDEYLRLVHNQKELKVADRWWTSTFVYQHKLQNIPLKFLEYTIHPEEKIDCVFILTGDDEILINRVLQERAKNPSHQLDAWTRKLRDINPILNRYYTNDLPDYLKSKHIRYEIIDTTSINTEQVYDRMNKTIQSLL